jgi:chromosome transmission fidelity protein 4
VSRILTLNLLSLLPQHLNSEATIKVIDIEDTVNMSVLHGHNDVVRKVTWEPSGSFLVRLPALVVPRMLTTEMSLQTSCCADGKVIVWDLTQQEPRQAKLIDGIIPAIKDKEYVDHCDP